MDNQLHPLILQALATYVPGMPLGFVQVEDGDEYYGECKPDTIIVTNLWTELDVQGQLFVVLHEIAHARTTGRHDEPFYDELTKLLIDHPTIPWDTILELEGVVPSSWPEQFKARV